MEWIGGRFFNPHGGWIDAATGESVRVRIDGADPATDLDWNEQCARLANLRHTLLNPLLDFGIGAGGRRFEVYAINDAAPVPAASAATALENVARFVLAAGVTLSPTRCGAAMRPVIAGRGGARFFGRALQPRAALGLIEETLDAAGPPGPVIVHVSGAAGSGLRTLLTLSARSARLRGFTPVSPSAAARYPMLLDTVVDRHVCVLDDIDDTERSATAVAEMVGLLGAASSRRHVVIRFHRRRHGLPAGVALDPMPTPSLIRMVFTDGPTGPSDDELFSAARQAEGLPGAFLWHLNHAFPSASRGFIVHEARVRYVVEASPGTPPPATGGRVLGGALRAVPRAAALARAGRHAAAVRVLTRGLRVLEGRERTREAAECALQLGWLAVDRGDAATATIHFDLSRRLSGDSPRGVLASVGAGTALIDADRLVEAEAVLRGALAAAATLEDAETGRAATAGLMRCLYWQGRPHDAIALAPQQTIPAVSRAPDALLLGTFARCLARVGRTGDAVRAAREAQSVAIGLNDPSAAAGAELALAESLIAAGDVDGARASLISAERGARLAHLPLVRLRVHLVRATIRADDKNRVLRAAGRINLPPLLARRVAAALLAPAGPRRAAVEPVAEVERLLGVSQQAPDDDTALARVCAAVEERLTAAAVAVITADARVLVIAGRSWPAITAVTKQALACGASVPPDGRREPQEAAEPIRFGGEVIAVIACRWTAGVTIDPHATQAMLRAASLAAAPHVRAVLDRRLPEPPAAWADLLGESAPAVALRDSVLRAARAPFPVLIEGESGSGKELVARAVHRLGPRRDRRFCALNCAALTDDLVEAELFGHSRGAFTGAATERAGLFEEADGGTLFLDEIGELSPRAQAKLLRVLQEGEVRRVGENMPRHVDVRVVAATNRRLADEVAAGRFRADLRFRLDVVRMTVPPLRERSSDVPLLAAHFWRDASTRVGSQATLSPDALSALARYDWPGNVRELQNVIASIAVHSPRRGRIGPSALPRHFAQAAVPPRCTFEAAREDFERRFIRAALTGAAGQRARAAADIGVSRQGLAKMMKRLKMDDL